MDVKKYIDELRTRARKAYIPVMREKTTELLAEITAEKRPSRVLEIGTSLGVSGITVLVSGADRLCTVEIDGSVIDLAEKNFSACGVRDRVEFIEGDCFEVLPYMDNNRYDMAILDGPKSKYCEMFDLILPMMNGGGVIFCDDVDFFGLVKQTSPIRKHRTIIRGMQKFYDKVTADTRVSAKFLPIEDGVAVITVKTEED